MDQLNKWQKELQKLEAKHYQQTNSELFNVYRQSLIDIKKKLYNFTQAYPNLSFSSRLEVERLFNVATEIDGILSSSYGSIEETIKDYSAGQAEHGYYGTWYALEQAENVTLQMPLINHDYVMNLVNAPVAGKRLSKRLYHQRDQLAKNVTNEIVNGLFAGDSYAKIARRVSDQTEATYKQALRIVTTEGGRTSSITQQKSSENAKALGIDMEKRWLSTLDGKTRHNHRELDGQTVAIEDDFTINGHKAKGPRLFGIAKEDIRCRCTSINIVNGIAPELRKDNDTKKLIKYQNYNEWFKDVMADPERKLTHFKTLNKKKDEEQFSRYFQFVRGDKMPGSLAEFQRLKYNDSIGWDQLRTAYNDGRLQSSIRDGSFNLTIKEEAQERHNINNPQHDGKRSYLLEGIDPQDLVNRYAGTGEIQRSARGKFQNKELITLDEFIGVNINGATGVTSFTNKFYIHYSKKNGTHIVPTRKGDPDDA